MPPRIAESRGPVLNITDARRYTTITATTDVTITATVIGTTIAKYRH
jgi:hypothetical protein